MQSSFLGLDFQTVGSILETFGGFPGASYTGTEFHDILRLKLILLDGTNVLDIYRPILAHMGDKRRFLAFMLIE